MVQGWYCIPRKINRQEIVGSRKKVLKKTTRNFSRLSHFVPLAGKLFSFWVTDSRITKFKSVFNTSTDSSGKYNCSSTTGDRSSCLFHQRQEQMSARRKNTEIKKKKRYKEKFQHCATLSYKIATFYANVTEVNTNNIPE